MEYLDTCGRTAEQALTDFFEWEYCSECGRDADAHTPVPLLGNFFFRCNQEPIR